MFYNSDALGQAYLYYDEYAKDMERKGLKAVNFWNFLIGKR